MDFGLNFFPVITPERKSAAQYYQETIRLAVLAESLGFAHVQTVEHYGSPYGGYCPDPVALLAAVAARTSTIRLTTGAVIASFNHPLKTAARLAMLDNLSDGRLDAGFGRGFLPDEFAWFQVPMAQSRARFAEMLDACVALWSGQDVTWTGEFYRFGPVTLLPRPVQRPHPPVYVASATSAESCAAAGKAGHHLQVVPSVASREQLREMLAAYREAWASSGRPDRPRIQIKYTCYLSEDRAEALAAAELFERNYIAHMAGAVAGWAGARSDQYPGYEQFVDKVRRYDFDAALAATKVLAGTPAEVRDQLAAVAGWYGDDLTVSVQISPGHMPYEQSERALRLFADRVMAEV
ncbi:LLM class flavin-dependent oxidoreductase [Streptomyces sp. NPDC047017]|uniref:LLM class flavin-dependent oxidoreductase n=1 Tax=Streptomyces sp. NPDC047017 TaxID=3155024 RepID=UPI0033FEE862